MKTLITTLFLLLNIVSVFANDDLKTLICDNQDGKTLHATIDNRQAGHPNLYGIALIESDDSFTPGLEVFEDILLKSNKCKDLSLRTLVKKGQAFICSGELFTPKGFVYGQVAITNGSVKVFIDIASEQGWKCSIK